MRFIPTITPPFGAVAPPMSPVPEPRGTIGTAPRTAQAHDVRHLLGRLAGAPPASGMPL